MHDINVKNKRSEAKLLFTGDVFSENFSFDISDEFLHILSSHDINCCNFEAPISEKDQIPALEDGVKLSQPLEVYNKLKRAGFNLFALANNHIMNYGERGLLNTIKCIPKGDYIGAGIGEDEVYEARIYSFGTIKIGILNCAECQYGTIEEYKRVGYAWIGSKRIIDAISKLKNVCDYTIMVCHAGFENLPVPMPEWIDEYHKFIDLGANIIIGHHPHVIQGWEKYHGGMIFYSLGNFIWNSSNVKSCTNPSFAVSIYFCESNYTTEVIPVVFRDNCLNVLSNDSINNELTLLNDMLINRTELESIVNKACAIQTSKYETKVFEMVGLRPNTRLRNRLLNIIKECFGKNIINDRRMYLFVSNETLRWTIRRGITRNERKF